MFNLRKLVGGVALGVFLACGLISMRAGADSGSLWLSPAPLTLTKLADVPAVPTAQIGNGDCLLDTGGICASSEPYGLAGANGMARLAYSPKYYPVMTSVDGRQHFAGVPNSDLAISYTSGPSYGLYAYFNYHFSVSFVDQGSTKYYQMNGAPDGSLADRAGHHLAVDPPSAAFSANGEWMVISADNLAMVRVNLRTFEVLPFGAGFPYDIGLSPQPVTAITNDGRYAAVGSWDFSKFTIYDLSTCATAVPDIITGPVACQSRDLRPLVAAQTGNVGIPSSLRFLSDDSLSFYTRYSQDGVSKIAKFNLSAAGGPLHQQDYLALGDSYISGEGAFKYLPGTDTKDNKCHVSQISYPLLIGQELNYNSYHSVACSGATTQDVIDTTGGYKSQARPLTTRDNLEKENKVNEILSSFQQGYIDQLDFVKEYQPKTITISAGGNDIGFSSRLQECLKPGTCYSSYEDRLEFVREVNNTFPKLVSTYQKLLAAGPPDMRAYVIGYPQIAKADGNCGLNVHMDKAELEFAGQAIDYLDTVIKAAAKAGVYYVDTQDALAGHRLCEAEPGSQAMNGLTAGNDLPDLLGGPIGRESYHPNDFGHLLLENKILAATHNLTAAMPAADLNVAPPPETSLAILNVPPSGRQVNVTEYDPDLTDDMVYRGTAADVSLDGVRHGIAPNASLSAEIHSSPINLGVYHPDSNGNLSTTVMIPADIPAGYHSLHFYGTDISGQPIDVFKTIYVAAAADDLDGNGVTDSRQACVGLDPSGVDFDKDGVDDSCDGSISQPPVVQPAVLLTTGAPWQMTSPKALIQASSQPDMAETAVSNPPDSAGQKVLADQTADPSAPATPASSEKNRNLNSYYLAAGIGFLTLAALGYIFRRV